MKKLHRQKKIRQDLELHIDTKFNSNKEYYHNSHALIYDDFDYIFDIDFLSDFIEKSKTMKSKFIGLNITVYNGYYDAEINNVKFTSYDIEDESDESYNKRLKIFTKQEEEREKKISDAENKKKQKKEEKEIAMLLKLKEKYPSIQ